MKNYYNFSCIFTCVFGYFRCASFRKWRYDTGVKLIFLNWLWLRIMKLDTETIVSYTYAFKVDDVELGDYDEIVNDLLGIKIFWPFHLGNEIFITVDFQFICLFIAWCEKRRRLQQLSRRCGRRPTQIQMCEHLEHHSLFRSPLYNIIKFMCSSLYSLRRYLYIFFL